MNTKILAVVGAIIVTGGLAWLIVHKEGKNLTEVDADKRTILRVDNIFTITLQASGLYIWTCDYDTALFSLQRDSIKTGAGFEYKEVWTFKAIHTGDAVITMDYALAGEVPDRSLQFDIEIVPSI